MATAGTPTLADAVNQARDPTGTGGFGALARAAMLPSQGIGAVADYLAPPAAVAMNYVAGYTPQNAPIQNPAPVPATNVLPPMTLGGAPVNQAYTPVGQGMGTPNPGPSAFAMHPAVAALPGGTPHDHGALSAAAGIAPPTPDQPGKTYYREDLYDALSQMTRGQLNAWKASQIPPMDAKAQAQHGLVNLLQERYNEERAAAAYGKVLNPESPLNLARNRLIAGYQRFLPQGLGLGLSPEAQSASGGGMP